MCARCYHLELAREREREYQSTLSGIEVSFRKLWLMCRFVLEMWLCVILICLRAFAAFVFLIVASIPIWGITMLIEYLRT